MTTAAGTVQEQAREVFRQSLAAEMPLSGRQLGEMFERGERWGRQRITEVRQGLAASRNADLTGGSAGRQSSDQQVAAESAVSAVAAEDTALLPAVAAGAAVPQRQDGSEAAAERHSERQAAVPEEAERQPETVPSAVAEVVPDAGSGSGSVPDSGSAVPQRRGAKAVSWCAFVFGVVVSVAANVAHTLYPTAAQLAEWTKAPHAAGAQWHPEVGEQIAAAFWPLALLLAVEVLTRVRWRPGASWSLARFGGTGAVALVAAVMSYRHMQGLLGAYGEDGLSSAIGPLAVDGLMVVAGFALLSMGERRERR